MGAISRKLSEFCYKHPNFGIPGLMKYVAVANVVVYLLDLMLNGMATYLLSFHPYFIFQGQIWRIFTFVLVPQRFDFVLWFILSTFFYYWIGTALERQWGSGRFTMYYGLGVLFNIIIGLVGGYVVSMFYVNMSMFFAFATLYPDMQVMLWGILPVKVKWMAWLDIAFFAYAMVTSLLGGSLAGVIIPLVALFNYFIVFGEDLVAMVRGSRQRAAYRRSPQVVNFKKAQKEIRQQKGYLHKCEVCGVTDQLNPDMEFRYCSKCSGYHCYCMDHINDHTHVV